MSEFLSQLYAAVLPPLLALLSIILGRVIARAATVAQERWGIEVEARHREALQSAVMTGITAAMGRGLRGPEAIRAAIEYTLSKGAPDAVDFFDLGMEDLSRIAESKLQRQWSAITADFGQPFEAAGSFTEARGG